MKRYTVTFLFTPDLDSVWLIEKQKPDWQKDCLNGIGGKIEDGETPMQCALRELEEEAGTKMDEHSLVELGEMIGTNNDGSKFQVYIFTGATYDLLETQEEEEIGLYAVNLIKETRHIENVPMLIEACLYRLSGQHSSFSRLIMQYEKVKD